MRFLAGISLGVLIAGCATTSTMSSNDAESYIRSAAPRFISAFNAGNADTIAAMYTDDAVLLVPNAPIAKGNAAIHDAYRSFFNSTHATLNFAADRIVQSGDVAYEYGHYTMGMGSMNDQGNYVTVWRRQSNGDWKMVEDSINSSMPMAH